MTSAIDNLRSEIERADDGIRTRDLRFTKPLLYQLSYVGAGGKDYIRQREGQARRLESVGARVLTRKP
jgi:hypothetical protein